MKSGTSVNSTKDAVQGQTRIRDAFETAEETLFDFERKVSNAMLGGDEIIETHEKIINHFNPGGLNGSPYFIYKGVRVCLTGETEKVLKDPLSVQASKRLHGTKEATVEGPTS